MDHGYELVIGQSIKRFRHISKQVYIFHSATLLRNWNLKRGFPGTVYISAVMITLVYIAK